MILNLLLLFFFGHNINEEIAIENLVGNWKRVCLENDALLSKSAIKIEKSRNLLGVKVKKYNSSASKLDAISHCNFFGDKENAVEKIKSELTEPQNLLNRIKEVECQNSKLTFF